ncbi:MAG: EamA family transporter [Bacteroidales bacterium]
MKIINTIFLLIILCSCQQNHKNALINNVNLFVGTTEQRHTFPVATMPTGMLQVSPNTRLKSWDRFGWYHYSDSISLKAIEMARLPIAYAGIFSINTAFLLQIYAQQFVPENIARILFSSESLFALLGSILSLNEKFFKAMDRFSAYFICTTFYTNNQ